MNLIALGAISDDGSHYLFHYADFRYARRSANPALEDDPKASPERLQLVFTSGEITILGMGLRSLEEHVQTGSLKSIAASNQGDQRCCVRSISITIKENP